MLGVGVYDGENWQTGQRLKIDPTTTMLPRFESDTLLRVGGYTQDTEGIWSPISLQGDAPQRALDARLGEHIILTGADVPATGEGHTVNFALHWQSDGAIDFDYTAFAHLLDATGEKVAQLDWQPRDAVGLLPATQWPTDRPIVDRQRLSLPERLPAGDYQLIVGLYDWRDGARLPVQGADAVPGDAVLAGSVRLPEPNMDK
jgi:hypothetical protein